MKDLIPPVQSDDTRTRIIIANANPAYHADVKQIVSQLHPHADVIIMPAVPVPDVVPAEIVVAPQGRNLDRLSTRQRDVLALIVEGQTNKDIARSLDISPSTVRVHVSALLRILGVSSRTAAAAIAASALSQQDAIHTAQ
ncbi:MAG: helix-turn-helix transcriptional regulator [Paracoccus sp. (in: a-proteobacteria)]|nr:helix-turn-helix transcriptional regulator [Paracoccus sp. (in: a-proteobacteria)]